MIWITDVITDSIYGEIIYNIARKMHVIADACIDIRVTLEMTIKTWQISIKMVNIIS